MGYNVVSVGECENPEVSNRHLQNTFVPYPHYIVFDFEAVLRRLNLGLTFDLKIGCSHILVIVAINDSLTNESIFIENRNLERLIEEFVAELTRRQKIISKEVWNRYPMSDEFSLPKQVRERWMNWANQVPVFGFNSRKYDLNLVKEYFVSTLSNMSDVTVVKKDNSYMFLTSPMFKFLDVKNYLAPGLSYDSWCKANGCTVSELVFPYEWLNDYNKLSHVGPVKYKTSSLSLRVDLLLLRVNTTSLFENFTPEVV